MVTVADEDASMAANNTSAFDCRRVAGSSSWSEHAYGRAIDVNPVQNPWVSSSGSTVAPEAGRPWLDRRFASPGMVRTGDEVVAAFAASRRRVVRGRRGVLGRAGAVGERVPAGVANRRACRRAAVRA